MDYPAGAGNGPFGVHTELCGFGGFPPFFPVLWLAAWGGGHWPMRLRTPAIMGGPHEKMYKTIRTNQQIKDPCTLLTHPL